MANSSGTSSRVLQITALIIFAFGLWRFWKYYVDPYSTLELSQYLLYTAWAAVVIAVGVLFFDEVYKPKDVFVGWAFLLGVGCFSLLTGVFFFFYPHIDISHPIWVFPTRVVAFFGFGVLLIIESLFVRRNTIKGSRGLNSDTVAPILLKFAAIFTIAWGVYQLGWLLFALIIGGGTLTTMWQTVLLVVGTLLAGIVSIIWVERQKRAPHYRGRRLPLLMSFLMILSALPIIGVYLAIPYTLILPISLLLGFALITISFYIVYRPIKSR